MRFVVLHHTDWPGHPDHYDLMFQTAPGENDDDQVLLTFSTQRDILPDGNNREPLFRGEAHRRFYLDFEGRITGERGITKCVDRGEIIEFSMEKVGSIFYANLVGTRFKGLYRIEMNDAGSGVLLRIG